ncbi:hypothetical protein KUTeg_013538 [Tegillarca granosa]|uniref:Leucine-rich repeat-containing protein 41 n=1 Tax=Tegillarca granosa TaxID=220873 RepID=A0ABQ9ETZ6_TEGGR|nr:hypothetical protein KUTeg_013538 [Tegillarca granosa]
MQSLLYLSSASVGYNASLYSTESLSGLPNSVLERVLPYLSACELHRISEDLSHKGLLLNNLWKCHVKTRWKRKSSVITEFYKEDGEEKDHHKLYLNIHFLDLLNFCAVEKRENDPCVIYITPLHRLRISAGLLTTDYLSIENHSEELVKFSKYGYIIKGNAVICSYICSHKELLETLLDVTEKVQIYNITDSGYNIIRYFLQLFISIGKIRHGTFTVTGKLALKNVNDMFQVCAGIHECKNMKVQCFCDTLSDSNSDCKFVNSCDVENMYTVESNQKGAQKQFEGFISDQEDDKMFDFPVDSDKILVAPDCDIVEKHMDGIEDTFGDSCSKGENNTKSEEIDLFKEALTPLLNELPPDKISKIPGSSVHKDNNKCLSSGEANIPDSSHSSSGIISQKRKRPYPFTDQEKVVCIKGIKQFKLQQSGKNLVQNSTLTPRSLTSILCVNNSIIKSSEHSKGICTAISQVLPSWTSLKQIGLFHTDASSQDIMNSLLHKVERHELTHLLFHDVIVPMNFFGRILEILQKFYRFTGDSENVWKPLEVLDLNISVPYIVVPKAIQITAPVLGVRRLNLSMNFLRDSAVSALVTLIRCDTALIELQLNHCFMKEHQVISVLQAVRDKNQMQDLSLNGNNINIKTTEKELLNILMSVKSLRSLSLNYCQLRHDFESAAVQMLTELCCEDTPSLHYLDISYNWIEGKDLLAAARKIKLKQCHKVGPLLKYLCVSGNRLSFSEQKQLRLCFNGIVKEFKADCIDFTHPYAEYQAQV